MKFSAGKVAVVTGGASGIGLALCREFAGRGMHVVVADIDQGALDSAAEQLADAAAGEIWPAKVDVTSWDAVDALASEVFSRFGGAHVICNNAGVIPPRAPIWETDLEDWRWVLSVDLWGVVHGIKAFVPRMLAGGEEGHVVNTASIAGLLGFKSIASYSAAKFAVVAASEALKAGLDAEGAPIGVSVLCPGDVATALRVTSDRLRPGGAGWNEDADLSAAPGAKTPDEIARLVLDAIEAERFWILPHDYSAQLTERTNGMVQFHAVPEGTTR